MNLSVRGKIHKYYILGCALVWDLCGGGPNRNGYKGAWDFFDPKCYILGVKFTSPQYNVFHKTAFFVLLGRPRGDFRATCSQYNGFCLGKLYL